MKYIVLNRREKVIVLILILGVLLSMLGLFIFYTIIETAVRRGIDSSDTGQLIQRYLAVKKAEVSNEVIEKELEQEIKED